MTGRRLSTLVRQDLDADPEILGVTADSRRVRPGFLFAALPGSKADGRRFIGDALRAGAAAVLAPDDVGDLQAPVVHAPDLRRTYALAAAAFYAAQPRTCVAVTGTNGKTSVASFCRQIFERLGHASAAMGTLGVQAGGEDLTPPGLTTPDAADIARLLADLAGRGVTHLALEASSHGIDQRRLDGVVLEAAAFTNLTRDHLDYHGDMDAYRSAKLRLFSAVLPAGGLAVLNADGEAFQAFAAAAVDAGHGVMTVGRKGAALRLTASAPAAEGQRLAVQTPTAAYDLLLPLAGEFQASNALVAAGLCLAAGEAEAQVLAALEHLGGVPGRLQRVPGPGGAEAYVDYAHTPDGLRTALTALRPRAAGRLIVVFGAGGERDPDKRPLMGEAAARLADLVIVTDDNPRSEDPAAIRAAVMAGAAGALEIGDRRAAIAAAAEMLKDGDVLLVAGKGHEQGQIVGDEVRPFDDRSETAAALDAAHG